MPKLYVIAGEPSGDFLGAGVLRELGDRCDIRGVGGHLMETAGLVSLFDIRNISVGGLLEVVPHLLKIKRLIAQTVDDIAANRPDVLLTIDSPGFCFRVARLVRKRCPEIKMVHLVAPSVWAWREGRAAKLAKLYDRLFCLFDFEPQYFTKYVLDATFVGHPAVERFEFSEHRGKDTLLVMPGSRTQEIKSLLPIFLEAAKGVAGRLGTTRLVIPTLPHLLPLVKSIAGDDADVTADGEVKMQVYQSARLAIVASGTATLQLALSGCPMVVGYRLSELSYRLVKPLVKVRYISLVNLILNAPVVPELIQSDCTVQKITDVAVSLDEAEQLRQFKRLRERLTPGSTTPSKVIAEGVLRACGNKAREF